jgi:hypothetical protein
MPRAQDFSQATIYHIRHVVSRQVIYVGSTCSFATRVRGHKSKCNNPTGTHYHYPVYQHIRENGGWDAYHVVPVSHHNLQNKVELQILEQAEIDKYDDLKNAYFAKRSPAEYQRDNVVALTEYNAQYHQTNAVAIAERQSTKIRCECGCMSTKGAIAAHRKTARHLKWVADSDYEVFKLVPLFQ